MIDFIGLLKEKYTVKERNIGAYAVMKKNGMKFNISAYEIEGIGNMSYFTMSAMLGLMKMQTVVFTPLTVDAPLFSFDYINAMGNETLMLELYSTQLGDIDVSSLDEIKARYHALPDHDLGSHWYDHLKMSPTLAKKGKKLTEDYKKLCEEFFRGYVTVLSTAAPCERGPKQEKVREYTNGLLNNGGPATDQFRKLFGEEATVELFTKYIFSSES